MKKIAYISLFVFLGVLVSFVVHGAIEVPAIYLLLSDFELFGLGLSWEAWIMLHNAGSFLLLLTGVIIGLKQGKHWWEKMYAKKS